MRSYVKETNSNNKLYLTGFGFSKLFHCVFVVFTCKDFNTTAEVTTEGATLLI